MSQDSLTLSGAKICSELAKYLRFLRYKFSPWFTLAIAPFKLLFASSVQRTYTKIRCMSAISKIDFADVYGLLNDLLW